MHPDKDKLDESDSIIWDEAKDAMDYLESKLNIEQIKKVEEMAKKSIN